MKFHFSKSVIILLCLTTITVTSSLNCQIMKESTIKKQTDVPVVLPRSEDVTTLDGIIKAFYETISGPIGRPREWERDRTLYIPGVRFVSTNVKNGKPVIKVLDHQQYIDEANDVLVQKGFFEKEIHRIVKTFGNITHVFSTYESRYTIDGPVIARGINSIELFNDGNRWWIAAAIWDVERIDNPIPSDMLH